MLYTILIVLLILAIIGGVPTGFYGGGPVVGSGLGVVLVIVLILILLGRV